VIPLLAHVYPNGLADVNHFHAAGGLGFVMRELLEAGLLHDDVLTILGEGLNRFCVEPGLDGNTIQWRDAQPESLDKDVLRPVSDAFDKEGGLRMVQGNIGRGMVKVSAVAPEHHKISASARVFESQIGFIEAFKAGKLDADMVAVVRYQGACANGMPELHKLTPYLGVLQNRGFKVALLTDGRMSGASGKILAAIQLSPEALDGGLIAKIQDGDRINIDAEAGLLCAEAVGEPFESRVATKPDLSFNHTGMGRELFGAFRQQASSAETGASIFTRVD
jgi:phosphogluconate dehydratase